MKLRKMCFEDNTKIVRWKNQPFVVANFLNKRPLTKEIHNKWFKERVCTGEVAQYIICLDDGNEIGSVYLRDIDLQNKKAEFGIFIGEKWALGKGYGYQAAREICRIGFKELGLHKIFLRVIDTNKAAIHMYEKAGFVTEGIALQDIWDGEKYIDIRFMAMNENNFCEK